MYKDNFFKGVKIGIGFLVIGLPIIFFPGGYSDFRLPKEIYFQSISTILVAIWIIALNINRDFKRVWRQLLCDKILIFLLIFLMTACFSLLYGGTYYLGKNQVINFILAVFLYAIIRTTFRLEDISIMVILFLFSAFIISTVAIFQYHGLLLHNWPGLDRKSTAYASIGHSNTVGTYLMMAVPIAFAYLKQAAPGLRQWLMVLITLVIIAGLSHSLAFTAYVGSLGGLFFFMILTHKPELPSVKWLTLIALTAICLGWVLWTTPLYHFLDFRIDKIMEGDWNAAWLLIKQSLFLGHGIGSYAFYLPEALDASYAAHLDAVIHPQHIIHAHNEYLEIGAEVGLIGLSIMFYILVVFIWNLQKSRKIFNQIKETTKSQERAYLYAAGFGASVFSIAINCLAHFPLHLAVTGFSTLLCAALTSTALDALQADMPLTISTLIRQIKPFFPPPGIVTH